MLHPTDSALSYEISDFNRHRNVTPDFIKLKKFMQMFENDVTNVLRQLNTERSNILHSPSKRFFDFLVKVYGKDTTVEILKNAVKMSGFNRRKHLLSAVTGKGGAKNNRRRTRKRSTRKSGK